MKNITAHLSLLTCNLIWACAYPLYNLVMPNHIKPLPLYTATIIFTALVSLLSLFFERRDDERNRVERRDIGAIIGAALLIALLRKSMLLFGLSMTSPIDGSIIASISPVVVLSISLISGVELFSGRRALGILLGFGGAIGVILTGGGGAQAERGVWGNLLILLCAFISSIYVVWFKSLLARYSSTTLLRWMFCVAAIITAPVGMKSLLETSVEGWSLHIWLAVAYLVVLPTYLPNLLMTFGLNRVSPSMTSIYMYLQPTVAVAISVAFGLDKLRALTILFAALIFTGVGLAISSPATTKDEA
ncbi:MAG: DMT family transporter [Rikenellaceae bacterium]